MVSFLGNRKYRDTALQAAFVTVIAAAVVFAILIARRNMEIQNISMDWTFLQYSTGWSISFSILPYDGSSTYARALAVGLVNTIFLGTISVALATVIGIVAGTARLSTHKLVRLIAATYIQIFRNLPLILQAYFWYTLVTHLPGPRSAIAIPGSVFLLNRGVYLPGINTTSVAIGLAIALVAAGFALNTLVAYVAKGRGVRAHPAVYYGILAGSITLAAVILFIFRSTDLPFFNVPHLKGLRFDGGILLPPEVAAVIVAISLFGGSYIAEIVRSGLQAVPKGLGEAAAALGLSSWQAFWKVKLPMAVRIVMPTMTNQVVWLMKATTIGIAVGYRDFFAVVSTSINSTGQSITLIIILVLGFWTINMSIAAIMNWVNAAIAIPGRNTR